MSARFAARWIVLACSQALQCGLAASLEEEFRSPPPSARPQAWWHWMSGNITAEGIRADLAAMHRIGLGGVHIFNVAYGEPPGFVVVYSDEWHARVQQALREANRLGLEITMHICPGWSQSGGPWVPPELAMQENTVARTNVSGGAVSLRLPTPPAQHGVYADIAVLAVPQSPLEPPPVHELRPTVLGPLPDEDLARRVDGRADTVAHLPLPATNAPVIVQMEFPEPHVWGWTRPRTGTFPEFPWEADVEVSDNGNGTTWRRVGRYPVTISPSVAFAPVTSRHLRIVIRRAHFFLARRLTIEEIELGGPRIWEFPKKAAWSTGRIAPRAAGTGTWPLVVAPRAQMLDLTEQSTPDGQLDAELPPGEWTILRIGHTPTGMINKPAVPEGTGLECDKLSVRAVTAFFEGAMGRILREAGPLAGRTLRGVLLDSWEAYCQNWTPAMPDEFRRRRGYDLRPWLPALVGWVIDNEETTERVLWDVRRTIAELLADVYLDMLRQLVHRHGLHLIGEVVGINTPTTADQFLCKGRADIPMGEFWLHGSQDVKEAAAAAHVYGKRLVAAESFTASREQAGWRSEPYSLKPLGDYAFTLGLNHIAFHRYAHQPWLDRVPGMTMGPWGINFERTATWWEPGAAWIRYLSRCQHLLQQGRVVADVLYYLGEDAPLELPPPSELQPPPMSYDYDACGAEVLMTRLVVRDGRLVLPEGGSYRVLVLAPDDRMRPEVARKLLELVREGAVAVGPKPWRSPSLAGGPQAGEELRRLADELWGPAPIAAERTVGRGRIVTTGSLERILEDLGVPPDVRITPPARTNRIGWIHRMIPGEPPTDIYFVCNRDPTPRRVEVSFRITDRRPEFWDPDSSRIEPAPQWRTENDRILLPLDFDPCGSVFVVFRASAAGADPIVRWTGPLEGAWLACDVAGAPRVTAWTNGEWRGDTEPDEPCSSARRPCPRRRRSWGRGGLSFQWAGARRRQSNSSGSCRSRTIRRRVFDTSPARRCGFSMCRRRRTARSRIRRCGAGSISAP